ncbi:MAG: ABC transporter permease [Bacteroidia bacterium]|nr:ABC transporter permease [Bacteroidia bacterium]
MQLSFFISKRLSQSKQTSFSKLIVRIATLAVAISVTVMLLAIAISRGYKQQVSQKLSNFQSHIIINNLDQNQSYQSLPIEGNADVEQFINAKNGFKHFQKYAIKAGIIKTENDFQGIVLKGVDSQFDFTYLKNSLIAGNIPKLDTVKLSNQILLSSSLAQKLGFKVGDGIFVYFIQDPPRVRKFNIVGIFDTNLGEIDDLYALVDIKQIQKLNGWSNNLFTGYEVFVNNFDSLEAKVDLLATITPYTMGITPINLVYPDLFNWLNMLDVNVMIILILMAAVAIINMVTALLILIVERSNMIGMLKALGLNNLNIIKIFLNLAAFIIIRGLLLGNALALGLGFLQQQFSFIKLSEKDYYVSAVPVSFQPFDFILVNVSCFVICLVLLLLPANVVSKISPVKSIRFD